MKSKSINLLALALLALFVGCQAKQEPALTVYEVPVAGDPAQTARETARLLQVNVQISGDENGANLAAPHLKNTLGDELAVNGFSVIEDDKAADLRLRGRVQVTDHTKRGNRIVVRGVATVSFFKQLTVSVAGDSLISTKTFEVKSPETFSAEEALLKFGMAFDTDLRKWVKETGSRVAAEIGACEIVFSELQAKDADPASLVNKISQLKGVYACRVTMNETDATKMTASVVYEKRQFPNGILAQLHALKALKVKGEK